MQCTGTIWPFIPWSYEWNQKTTNKHQWNICLSQHFTVHLCRKRITENLNVAFPFSVCCYPISFSLVSQSRALFSTVGFLRRLPLSRSKKFNTCIEMFPSADLCVKLHNFNNLSRFNLKFYRVFCSCLTARSMPTRSWCVLFHTVVNGVWIPVE